MGLKLITTEKKPLTLPLNFALSSPSFLPTVSLLPGPITLCCKDSTYVSIGMDVWVKVKKISMEQRFTTEVSSNCYLSTIENKITFWYEKIPHIDLILEILSLHASPFEIVTVSCLNTTFQRHSPTQV